MKKTKKYSKGFTLVELLVVIAIIGILAAVVLVSIGSSRTRAQLANFKTEVSHVQTELMNRCYSTTPLVTTGLPTSATNTNSQINAYTVGTTSCGPSGGGTFSVTATFQQNTACVATMTEAGNSFNATCAGI